DGHLAIAVIPFGRGDGVHVDRLQRCYDADRRRAQFMATKPAWQIDDQLDALLVLFRRSIGQRIADGDEALVGAAIGKLDPAHLERRKVEQGDEVFYYFKAAIRAVPGGPFNATVLAIDADGGEEIASLADV